MRNKSLILGIILTIKIGLLGIELSAQTNIETNNTELFKAVKTGDLKQVQTLIKTEPSLLECRDKNGYTPLIIACQTMNVEIAEYLIDKGANVNAKGGNLDITPLFATRKRKDESFDLAQKLIENGADVNAKLSYTFRNWTVLCDAIGSGNLRVTQMLIDNGADINNNDIQGTPLQSAIFQKKIEIAKLLIGNNAKLQEFSFGNTELHIAAIRGCDELIPHLVKYGIDVDVHNELGHTPLFYASMHGHRKTVEALIAAGANKNNIIEENYGKPAQLDENLQDGEAYLWSLEYGAYAVKTKNHLFVFSPLEANTNPDASLVNGYFNPVELKGQNTTILISGIPGFIVNDLIKAMPEANFIHDIKDLHVDENKVESHINYLTVKDSLSGDGIFIYTIQALQNGLGYLTETDGLKIFYAGRHACRNDSSQIVAYQKEIDNLKAYNPIDIAILPINGRHINLDYEPYLYLIDQLSPKAIYLMSDELVNEEPKKCVKVLQSKGIPVRYPEGGIAYGERFHHKKD